MAWELYDRFGAWPSMQFATPIRGTALHEQCVALGLIPPRRHRSQGRRAVPAPPVLRSAALPARLRRQGARRLRHEDGRPRSARKLIMNITYKCANRCVFCATGDRVSAALELGEDRRHPAPAPRRGHRPARHRRRRADAAPAPGRRHRPGARARLPLDQRHHATAACCATAPSPSACSTAASPIC